MGTVPLISIVDDDDSLWVSPDSLIRSAGFRVHEFLSAEAVLSSNGAHETNSLLLDLQLARRADVSFSVRSREPSGHLDHPPRPFN